MREIKLDEVASRLGKSVKQVRRYIKANWLSATTKVIDGRPTTFVYWYEELVHELEQRRLGTYKELVIGKQADSDQSVLLPEWLSWGEQGFLSREAWSPETAHNYHRRLQKYFTLKRALTPEGLVDLMALYSPEQYGERYMIYCALMTFAKYLIKKGLADESLQKRMKMFRPQRRQKPKQTVVTASKMESIFNYVETATTYSFHRRVTLKALILLLTYTGIRNSELRTLTVADVELMSDTPSITVMGKGAKKRCVGLNPEVVEALRLYLQYRPLSASPYFFLNEAGKQFSRDEIARKIRHLRAALNLDDITPHSFRRGLVTRGVAQGKNLLLLKDILGHEDIKITQIYSRLASDDVVSAMQEGW